MLFIVAAQQPIIRVDDDYRVVEDETTGKIFPNMVVMTRDDLRRFATQRLTHIFCSPAEIEAQIKGV